MRSCSHECYVTTDDGSYGIKGFGSTVLKDVLLKIGYQTDGDNSKV